MTLIVTALTVLVIIEILGRILYPVTRVARSSREANRDHRRWLSYLGPGGDAHTLLRDLYLMEKRYLPFLGWLSAPHIRLPTVETNTQGFRDSVIGSRREGEYRVLVTGASFAWGVGASSNAMSVSGQLETLLNQRRLERRYRVMNGAFLNWSSRQEYVVVTEFFELFDPDLVISLTGYNDLVALSKGVELDALPEARFLGQAVTNNLQPTGTLRALRKLGGTLGIWRIVVYIREILTARAPLPQQAYCYDVEGASLRVKRVVQRYLSITDFLIRKNRHYLIALEPEIYSSNKPLTVEEFDLKSRFLSMDRKLNEVLMQYRRDLTSELVAHSSEQFRLLDLAHIFDNESAPIFIDYNHVCDRGNLLVAQALAKAVEELASECRAGPT